MLENKKMAQAIEKVLEREDYVVSQANELAKAFGNLSLKEQKVLDFCFSYVKPTDKPEMVYETKAQDILRHLGINASGKNYEDVTKSMKNLHNKTPLSIRTIDDRGRRGIKMFHLFDNVEVKDDGEIEFSFSKTASPYVFELTKYFYSFRLWQLSGIKSKYGLTLLKLWESKRLGNDHKTTIDGTVEEWKHWLLGDPENREVEYAAGPFKQKCLQKGINSLEKVFPDVNFVLTTITNGRPVIGYRLEIYANDKLKGKPSVIPNDVIF